MTKNDADNLEEQLRPSEKYILAFAKANPDMPFSWREFAHKYEHGTIRNAFSILTNLRFLELQCRSTDAYYILRTADRRRSRQAVTVTHTEGKYNVRKMQIENYMEFLDSLGWEEIWKVHDINLCFEVQGLYEQIVKEGKLVPDEQSKDIQFLIIDWQRDRRLRVSLHRTGTVTCLLGCSTNPLDVTPEGLADLSAVLGKIQTRLEDALRASPEVATQVVPFVSNWVVTQWHCGKDGKREISGKSFNLTYKTWSGALVRIYLKKCGTKFRPRKETIEQPRKPLPNAFSDKAAANEKEHGIREMT